MGFGKNIKESLVAAQDQVFYLKNYGSVRASVLNLGNALITEASANVILKRPKSLSESGYAYDLDDAEFSTYFVGETPACVHSGRIQTALDRNAA
jgi:hypothetical protein